MSVMTKTENEKYCVECGSIINVKAEICPKCGVRQPVLHLHSKNNIALSGGRSRLGASLFAIFLGGLGIHKFYLGETDKGIIYLLLCWTFIPAIIGFVEGIILLSMTDNDFHQKYG